MSLKHSYNVRQSLDKKRDSILIFANELTVLSKFHKIIINKSLEDVWINLICHGDEGIVKSQISINLFQ